MPDKHYDYSKWDTVIFVDASGDDGLKFGKGSSDCYFVGCYICTPDEISLAKEVLKSVKKTVGCKETDEIKSNAMMKHPKFKTDVLPCLANLPGKFCGLNVYKKYIPNDDIFYRQDSFKDKKFSAAIHAFIMDYVLKYVGGKVLFVVDNMKKKEIDGINWMTNLQNVHLREHDVQFADSKDSRFQLIQAADLLAGIFRKSYEIHEQERGLVKNSKCLLCVKSKGRRRMCGSKTSKVSSSFFQRTKILRKLLVFNNGNPNETGLIIYPAVYHSNFHFIHCKFHK